MRMEHTKTEETVKLPENKRLTLSEDGRPTLPVSYRTNLSDFALFLSVMNNRRAYECTLSIILNEPDIRLSKIKTEEVILNDFGKRAIRLDAWALSEDQRQFNMEMQNDAKDDDMPKRSRFYQGLMDSPILKSGKRTKYKHLPSTVIIFITQEDIFKHDLAKYTFTEQCEEIAGLRLGDGTAKLFLNMTSKNGRDDLISLLQYMKDTTLENPEIIVKDERLIELDQIVTEVKESVEWEAVQMNLVEYGMERGKELGRQEGEEYGRREGVLQTLSSLVKDGLLELSLAAKQAGMSEAEFKEIMEKQPD